MLALSSSTLRDRSSISRRICVDAWSTSSRTGAAARVVANDGEQLVADPESSGSASYPSDLADLDRLDPTDRAVLYLREVEMWSSAGDHEYQAPPTADVDSRRCSDPGDLRQGVLMSLRVDLERLSERGEPPNETRSTPSESNQRRIPAERREPRSSCVHDGPWSDDAGQRGPECGRSKQPPCSMIPPRRSPSRSESGLRSPPRRRAGPTSADELSCRMNWWLLSVLPTGCLTSSRYRATITVPGVRGQSCRCSSEGCARVA